MQAFDLIINPPWRGGGRVAAIAVSDRLPVLIYKNNDAENFVPAGNVCVDENQIIERLETYLTFGVGYKVDYGLASGIVPFSDGYLKLCASDFEVAIHRAVERGAARLGLSRPQG